MGHLARPLPGLCLVSGQGVLARASLLGMSGRVFRVGLGFFGFGSSFFGSGHKSWLLPDPWIVVGQKYGHYSLVALIESSRVGFFW